MEILRKAVGRRGNGRKTKHEKLGDQWGTLKDPIIDGMTFYLKFLGSTLVEEIDEETGVSYGDKISSAAIKTIVAMAKSQNKKLPKVSLTVTPEILQVKNLYTKEVLSESAIHRVNFCTADRGHHGKVFAVILRNTTNETMECLAFLCHKRKLAEAVTLSVAQAFSIAQEWEQCANTITEQELKEHYLNTRQLLHIAPNTLKDGSGGSSGSMSPSSSTGDVSDESSSLENIGRLENDLDNCFSAFAQVRSHSKIRFTNSGSPSSEIPDITEWMQDENLSNLNKNTVDDLLLL